MLPAAIDPRTPVIIGSGQWTNRVDEGADPASPVELMVEATRRAASDAGVAGAPESLDAVLVVRLLSWRYRDPARLVAEALGCTGAVTGLTTMGGNSPQTLINRTAARIQEGALDLAVVCGGEAWRTRKDHLRDDRRPAWATQDAEVVPDETVGSELVMAHEAETAVGLVLPAQMYALLDHALRLDAGRSVDEQRRLIGELWARFSAVAAANPHAWNRREWTADQVMEPSAENRLVGHPYTKAVNSYEWVDQGAALLMCSARRAQDLGVAPHRWIFPVAGADAEDPPVSVRRNLHRSPSMAAAGRAVLDATGIAIDDVGIIDLYSCFPSAVQLAARELGVGLDRDLTVTGGMSFFGGPWNDYVTHSVASTVDRLRAEPDQVALCTANGGFATRQSFGVYAAQPGAGPFRHVLARTPADADGAGPRSVIQDHHGPATLEAWTVMHGRDGTPETAFAAALTAEGARVWATSSDTDTMAALMTGDLDRSTLDVAGGSFTPARCSV